MTKKFVGLIILDGFGIRSEEKGNAIKLANPENFNYYFKNFPSTLLDASGEAVGLPSGVIGNSETGHMNIGAGRLVNQNLQKINVSLKDGSFYETKELLNTIEHARKNNSNLHLMGLLSDGGVHSHINHLFGLIDMAKDKVRNVYIHAFLDGRDTQPDSGIKYVKELLNKIKPMQNVKLASIMGRFYAMDREQNWERTEKAYNALVLGAGNVSEDPIEAVKESYEKDITDEFVRPVVLSDVRIFDNDGIIFFNFRDDRARQLSKAFVEKKFKHFNRKYLENIYFCGFSKYDNFKNFHTAFEEDVFKVNLSQVVSKNKMKG